MKLKVTILLNDLIYQPYTDARAEVITIRKTCGVDRARSETKRKLCLEQGLAKEGMTMADWEALNKEADTLWKEVDGKPSIPRHWISGMLVAAISTLPKSARYGLTPENLRIHCRILGNWLVTSQTEVENFTRAIRNEASNQRRLQTDRVFEDVTLEGQISIIPPDDATPEDVITNYRRIFDYALRNNGLGGARKMGYGRGKVVTIAQP